MKDTVSYLAATPQTHLNEHHHAPARAAVLALRQTVAAAVRAALAARAVAAAARHALVAAHLEPVGAEGAAREAAALAVLALQAAVAQAILALLQVLRVRNGDVGRGFREHRGGVHRDVPRLRRNAIVVAIQLQ